MNNKEKEALIEKYRRATNKLILLDYDGTLVDYERIPDNAKLSEPLAEILIKLIDKPHTKVFIISGRSHYDIDKLLDHLTIDIIAEHGAMIKEGSGNWKHQVADNVLWKESIIPIMNMITSACPGSLRKKLFCHVALQKRRYSTGICFFKRINPYLRKNS
jgi:trehalose 6-phosphate synthase/phosphatase